MVDSTGPCTDISFLLSSPTTTTTTTTAAAIKPRPHRSQRRRSQRILSAFFTMETPAESPQARTTILGSFLGRNRPRNSSQSNIHVNTDNHNHRETSPSPPALPPSPIALVYPHRRRGVAVQPSSHAGSATTPTTQPLQVSSSTSQGLGLSNMLRRRRSAGNVSAPTSAVTPSSQPQMNPVAAAAVALGTARPPLPQSTSAPISKPSGSPIEHTLRLVPHMDSRRALCFTAVKRVLKAGDGPMRIGRFTDRSGLGVAAINVLHQNRIMFRSKVVSRNHADLWVEEGGKFLIRDIGSSSGTLLNNVRLSPAGDESKPFQIKDGDILQLGMDYQGGKEDVYKCVRMRVELNRDWQAAANAFNTGTLHQLTGSQKPKSATKLQIPDCCICLFPVAVHQALFTTPCSHTFHYKCIRPLIESHHPAFSCPVCRTYADLDEDVEVEPAESDIDLEGGDPMDVDEDGMNLGGIDLAPPEKDGGETDIEGEGAVPDRRNLPLPVPPVPAHNDAPSSRPASSAGGAVMCESVAEVEDEDGSPVERDEQVQLIQQQVGEQGTLPGTSKDGAVVVSEMGEAVDVDATIGGKRKR